MDLSLAVADQQRDAARRADLDRRDREHGGLTPHDRDAEEKRRSVKGWGPYRPETSAADINAARAGIDPRRVQLGRLWIDCGAAVGRWARQYRRHAAETLRNDTLLLLLRWPSQGQAPTLDLGGPGGTPMRRDWLTDDGQRTRLAWRALHAAVKQAAEAPSFLQLEAEQESATDPLDVAALVEAQQRDAGAPMRLPDAAAPETVAYLLGLPLDGGRAIVKRAYPAASIRELAASWGITEDAAKKALSRGAAAVRARYPDPADLLEALDHASAAWRAELESSAILTLIDYRDGMTDESAALDAVRDWRGASAGLPLAQRTLLAAARAALRRRGYGYGSARAETIAATVARLLAAETQRAQRHASVAARGSHLTGSV